MSNEELAQRYEVPVKAVALMRSLPNYDPFALARPTDYIDITKAEAFIELYNEHVKVPDGDDAGMPMPLEPWQEAILLNVYGWYQEDDNRRFREVIIYVPKKNSKTTFTAAWAAVEFRYFANFGAQFFSAAATREQAGLVFGAWCKILFFDEDLKEGTQIYGEKGPGTIKAIVREEMHQSYKPMSRDADTGDGVGPDFLLVDELHRHKDGELTETLEKSTAAKRNALILKTSTADYDRPSICNRMVERARLICANQGDPQQPGFAPRTLPVVYEVSPKEYKDNPDCWKDVKVWERVNPNFGVSITRDFAEEEIQKAIDDSSLLNNLLRLHLNIVTEQSEIWIPMDKYDDCQSTRNDEQLYDLPCWGGFDLSATQDLTSLCLAYRHPDRGYDMRWWYWIPDHKLHERSKKDNVPYEVWAADGFVELIPGEVVDMEHVQQRILQICRDHKVQEIGADKWNNSSTMQFLEKRGIHVLDFPQGPSAITEPGKELFRSIIEGTFRHGRNPIARWNFSNAMIKRAPNDTFSLDKQKAEKRIDGVAAAIMAVGVAMKGSKKSSAYATSGMVCGGFDE